MNFDDLTKVALVGTGRAAPTIATPEDETLASALVPAKSGGAEDQLLAAAAVLSAYETCGASATASTDVEISKAPADDRPACSRRASDLLGQILSMTNTPTKQRLIRDWLAAAARKKQRVPHALLPQLLDYAAGNRSVRDAAAAVVGQRGQWLMSLNRRWQFAAAEEVDVAKIWSTGNREQRTSALKRLRATDPAAARDLIQSTWKEDGADERAGFVEALTTGLSLADEPLLESALDDRSKQVRTAAAELLSRLGGSALTGRMIARVEPLLSYASKGGGLLKKSRPAAIEVTLPPDKFDPAWARDGVAEKPEDRTGRRQWWLLQMLRAIPPSHWSREWQLEPAECVAAAKGDFAKLLLDAWATAAERHVDTAWMHALLLDSVRRGEPLYNLVRRLPAELQRTAVAEVLAFPKTDANDLVQILDAVDFEFEPAAVDAVLTQIDRLVQKSGANYNYVLASVLESLVHRLPTDSYAPLSKRWTGTAWEANRKALDAFFLTLQMRRNIQTEFA